MAVYPASARERAMKVEEVILRALGKQITFWQAAHIARISPRHLRRLYDRYRRLGVLGGFYRPPGGAPPKSGARGGGGAGWLFVFERDGERTTESPSPTFF